MWSKGRSTGLAARQAWASIPVLKLVSCLALVKSLHLSEFQFLHVQKEDKLYKIYRIVLNI